MGSDVRQSLWRYLVAHDDKDNERAMLFMANQASLNRDSRRHLVAPLDAVAQIRKCHTHRFRHPFAIT
jgi:site-specific recombinase XerD